MRVGDVEVYDDSDHDDEEEEDDDDDDRQWWQIRMAGHGGR